jgi:ABC-type nitrate/sulfonate/bicarbonate transport system substrate-binding protein
MRFDRGQFRPLHYQDGAVESIAFQDGPQVLRRMALGKTDVGV